MSDRGVVANVLTRGILPDPILRVLSLGAGVQSTTLALMASKGLISPMPNCAIFADTQSEPEKVYQHLAWLEPLLAFPVHRVTAGNLRAEIVGGMEGKNRIGARPPFYVTSPGKSVGMLRRQCTHDYKLIPIQRKVRELIGLKPRQHGPKSPVVEQWIGISKDEAVRMKPSQLSYVQNRWPLLELEMSRKDCLRWMSDQGYPQPPKSACTFCPYHSNESWRALKLDPQAFADAVDLDKTIRPGIPGPRRPKGTQWFVHKSLKPLDQVDFSERDEADPFGMECEGMCGN